MVTTRILNPNATVRALENLVQEAFETVALGLDAEFANQISDVKWSWPNETIRERNIAGSGLTVRTPRNIIDTGNLDASVQLSKSRYEWMWVWDPVDPLSGFHYGLVVHEGATLRNGGKIKARPWVREGVIRYNPYLKFEQEVRKRV